MRVLSPPFFILRLRRVALSLQSFDLVDAVREVTDRLRESAASAGCSVLIDGDQRLDGRWDRLRLEQVISNLFSNSIKYAATLVVFVPDRCPCCGE